METNYKELLTNLEALISGIDYDITILSNASALFNEYLENINWVGFYLYKDGKLILGPFQGKVACMVIPLNRGVCGYCATNKETIIVKNVHEFKGHIACDSASESEICVPIIVNNELYGLLDIDSPTQNRFNDKDKENLEKAIEIIKKHLNQNI
ncbi:MAG: GAF domain-containing protein [Acholeplasmatales bacterium]|nr:GAF domain-containing protein [Acholeplasmatales bacterium]